MQASGKTAAYSQSTRLVHLPAFVSKLLFCKHFHPAASCVRCTLICPQLGNHFPVIEVLQVSSVFATKKRRHPCTARRRAAVCARGSAPAPAGQGERQECQRVSKKSRTLVEHSGKECGLKNPAHHQRAARPALVPAIVTDRPRRKDAAR